MKEFSLLAFVAAIVLCGFSSCEESASSGVATYYGTVIDETTDMPFDGVDVKVTNGDRIHTATQTNSDGYFSVDVRLQEVNQDYYVLLGNARIGTKRVDLPGFGNGRYDLGIITIKGPTVPTVETAEVTNIKSKMATGGGKVTSSGGFAVTKRGVCWGTSQYPTVTNDHTEDGTGAGEFFSNIGNLQPNTTYYVRAYAENEKGVAYGNQVTFRSASGVPKVTTKLVRVDSKTAVFYEGEVTDEGDSPVIAKGICWGTSTPNISNQKTEDGEGKGGYSGSITVGNVHSQNLYLRAYATNESGTAYGETMMIDHRNPYNLFKITEGGVSYLVLPYDLEASSFDSAREKCNNLVAYDYDDWDLPSLSVLSLIDDNKTEIGGFWGASYWSSSAYTSSYYYVLNFSSGSIRAEYKNSTYNVRPVRQY
ncbi:MAG: hypothetical protein IKO26_12515 [Paludibacteraceae bacterium]|nr:hypothetical protein [Paludibacteraceae bacterium]